MISADNAIVDTKQIWLGTVGLGPRMGGVGTVARLTVRALSTAYPQFRLRIIALHDATNPLGFLPPESRDRITYVQCHGNRSRFVWELSKQVTSRPTCVVYDHVDLAQTQYLLRWQPANYAIWIHGIEVWRRLPRRKEYVLRSANVLLSNSEFNEKKAREFRSQLPMTKVVPLCCEKTLVDLPAVEAVRKQQFTLLTVGRLVADRPKGHRQILRVLPALAKRFESIEWHVVGEGAWREEFEELVARSGVRDCVKFHGFVDDTKLGELYARSTLYCMPSLHEGFGLVYVEAMRRGCVCIGSTVDAATEVIGNAGYLVAPDDDQELTNAISELFLNQDLLADKQDAARQRAEEFSLSSFRTNLWEALRAGIGNSTWPESLELLDAKRV